MRAARLVTLALAVSASISGVAWAVPSFLVTEPLNVPRRPIDFAVGDLNNDGIDDIAIASRGTNKISIVLVEPNGAFRQGASLVVGTRIKGIAIGDFNHDGNGDVGISTGTHNVFVVLGKGDGTFLPNSRSTIRRCCSGAGVATGDFDGSFAGGKFGDDLVFADPINDDVNILFNKNQSNSAAFVVPGVRPKAGNKPVIVISADFNGDGKEDVGALNTSGVGNDSSSILNAGSGSFNNVGNFFSGKRARALSYGDYNKDGQTDLVTCDQRLNTVNLLPGLGGGLFGTGPQLMISCSDDMSTQAAVCTLRQAELADIDGDGNIDLGVLISGPASPSDTGSQVGGNVNALLVYLGDGFGNFTGPVRIPNLGFNSRLLKQGKFDNFDNKVDFAVISTRDSKLRLLLNTSGQTGGPTNTPTTGGTGGATPTPTPGGATPTRTATACRGQGCPCDPVNGDADCNDPFYCAADDEVCCDTPCDIANVACDIAGFVGTCKPIDLPDGDDCGAPDQCASGFCVDNFCCSTECSGNTEHCNNPPGQCSEGSPRPTPSTTATPTGGNGGGTSTPTHAGGGGTPTPTRVLKELGTPCASGPECRSTFCPSEDLVCCDSACNGANQRCDLPSQAGHCLPINLPNGDDCVVDAQCISNVCEGGVCVGSATRTPTRTATPVAQKTAGDQCTSGSECSSGFCPPDDGVCCDKACDGENERCDLSPLEGTCLSTDLPDGSTCQLEQQCRSRVCQGNVCIGNATPAFTPTRTPNGSRIPTFTRTATPPREPTLILSRGSGCSTGDDSSSGSLALILTLPAWWLITSRTRTAKVRRRPTRRS